MPAVRDGSRFSTAQVESESLYDEQMQLEQLVRASQGLSATSKRLKKIESLSELLQRADPQTVPTAVAFLCGHLRQGRIGLGWAALRDCLSSTAAVQQSSLRISEVESAFEAIAAQSGSGSAREKKRLLGQLLSQASEDERQFLAKLILGEMRQGALEGIMAEAIAKACAVPAQLVRRAWMLSGDLARTAQAAKSEGKEGLLSFDIELFRPVAPMLADSADDTDAALQRLEEAAFEFKLDGARIQVHKSGSDVRVFSRALNDVTAAVPEVVEAAQRLSAREIILDGEVLAQRENGRPLPFQVTMRRFGRKLDVERARRELALTPYIFDCLFLDGQSLIDQPTRERIELSDASLPRDLTVPRLISADRAQARRFWEASREAGHEGLVAKSLDAPYQAGRRGKGWLKIKQAVTLDLVILAAEWGSGRRKGWLSNLHLGARDASSERFLMLGKTFKGLTDRMLEWQTQKLLELESHRDQWTVYVKPRLVAEVAFNEIQESPHYDSGLALRFARIKGYRSDKSPHEATSIEEIRELFQSMRE